MCIAVRLRAAVGFVLGLAVAPAAVAAPAGTVAHDHARAAMQRLIVAEAAAADVPAALALAVAREASDFNYQALNAAGQVGVMQVLPATAAREFGVSAERLRDPVTNVRVGLHYLARLHHRYDGDWDQALAHYRGSAPSRHVADHDAPGYLRAYVDRVNRWWRLYRWDPAVQVEVRRAHGLSRFGDDTPTLAQPRFTDTTEYPAQDRWRSPWIAVTGSTRFR